VPACTARSAGRNSFRSPPDPPPQSLVSKIHAFGRHEWRRQSQTLHTLIAAGEKGAKFTGREAKQLFPVRNKGLIWKMDGNFAERDLRLLDQQWIASKQPRDQPMHDQLAVSLTISWLSGACMMPTH
jgi:hypothetical protein